jgi:hypothetical protein
MILYGLDVYGAFLNADIGETVYLQLPEGLTAADSEGNSPIWKLKKTLYALNRAPKAFYDHLSTYLLQHGNSRSPMDPCLFHKLLPTGKKIIFCVHVDDFAIAATHQELIQELCDILSKRFIITESDNLESFLGIHIVAHGDNLHLSQPGHIEKIIATAGATDIDKAVHIPMDPDFNDDHQNDSHNVITPSISNY